MKNLLPILALLLLSGCSMEEKDIRLLCDCKYMIEDSYNEEKTMCYSTTSDLNNIPLIINISEKKFHFNRFHYSNSVPQGNLYFEEDYISYFNKIEGRDYKSSRFDRVSLEYWEERQPTDTLIKSGILYQCRIVEGI